ncbi:MAG: hypothetical protein ACK5LC_07100 [Coprobacillaceae bacterium]
MKDLGVIIGVALAGVLIGLVITFILVKPLYQKKHKEPLSNVNTIISIAIFALIAIVVRTILTIM